MRRTLIWALALGLLGPPSTAASPWPAHLGRDQPDVVTGHRTIPGRDPGSDQDGRGPRRATDFWKVDISAKGATDVHIVENVIAAGGTFGWHSHPGPSLVIVKSGTLSVYHGPDCIAAEYGPGSPLGSTFVDEGGDLHVVRNNTTGVDDVYVVSFVPAGFARRIDEPNPDPAVCPN